MNSTATIKLKAEDGGIVATVNEISGALTNLSLASTALQFGFKGLEKASHLMRKAIDDAGGEVTFECVRSVAKQLGLNLYMTIERPERFYISAKHRTFDGRI